MLQAPSTVYQTSTYVEWHWATLTSTIVSRTTQYSTFTAAPSTVHDVATVTINSVLTVVSLLLVRLSPACDWSFVTLFKANPLQVLDRYGYATPAHRFANHAGEICYTISISNRFALLMPLPDHHLDPSALHKNRDRDPDYKLSIHPGRYSNLFRHDGIRNSANIFADYNPCSSSVDRGCHDHRSSIDLHGLANTDDQRADHRSMFTPNITPFDTVS